MEENHDLIFAHVLRVCTAKVFDKSDPEGDDAAKRELKNLKSLRHERMVSQPWRNGGKIEYLEYGLVLSYEGTAR